MSIAIQRAKFIRSMMLDVALKEGVEKGEEFFSQIWDFIGNISKGDGSVNPSAITKENRVALEVYSRAVKRWQAHRDKMREEFSRK